MIQALNQNLNQQLIQPLQQKWQNLAPREKQLLLVAIPVAVALALWLSVRGIMGWHDNLQKQVDRRIDTLADMQMLATILDDAGASQIAPSGNRITLAGRKLSLWQGNSSWNSRESAAMIDNRSFASVLNFLDTLEQEGIQPEALTLKRTTAGMVSGSILFDSAQR